VAECSDEGYSGAVLGRGFNGERGVMGLCFFGCMIMIDIHGVCA
jgi:hypothetical protein